MKGENIPISLLALVDAGYKTLHFVFPNFGSSEAKTLPIAEIDKWRKRTNSNNYDVYDNQASLLKDSYSNKTQTYTQTNINKKSPYPLFFYNKKQRQTKNLL